VGQATVDTPPGTVAPGAVDAGRLESYLRYRMPEAIAVEVDGVARISGGLSRETWAFDAAWDEGGRRVERSLVLRRDPDASLLTTSRDTEFGVLEALAGTPVPVPEVCWLESTSEWLDRPFFVMERVAGETSPAVLLADDRYDAARPVVARRKVEVLAALHRIEPGPRRIDGRDRPAPDECAAREIAHWEAELDEQELEPQPLLRGALEWLKRHPPPPARHIGFVHGDYRTGNFLFDTTGEITAVLDWELAHLGDPMEDVGYVAMCRFTPQGQLGQVGLVGGLYEREEFFELYEEHSGTPVDREAARFWEVLANVKVATIALTGARSFCDGRTRELQMAILGSVAHEPARTAIELIDAGRR
jgi:aminoglycoside phosphotransferase (APT) family kinase protein